MSIPSSTICGVDAVACTRTFGANPAEEAIHEAFASTLDIRLRGAYWKSPALGSYRPRINEAPHEDEEIEGDCLGLVFTCCHPVLPPEGQVLLTLREVCGLTTEEIAGAFLVTSATLAQRIVRAKAVIRDRAIPYQALICGNCRPGWERSSTWCI